jgi:hypothetical protein
VAQLERINGRARSSSINPGEKLVVYVSSDKAHATSAHEHERAPEPREKPAEALAVTRPIAAIEDDTGAAVRPATMDFPTAVPPAAPLGSPVRVAPASIGRGDAAASR